ncbi:oligosaccharide flippase family protein [Pseudoalteromonas distincta]|uniref:Polysaccharide biosynthesis protein n=1 Tax=Pseudoalteromonas distincta TaxID=77608 RepID=A0A4V1HD09_9GAMM|nr:oligosaccharide flippase family protein [Pseudoalteromonas distincta]QCU73135.1 hypothetical protein FFU37_01060 [Pseudoalteromonas distincta]
MTTTKSLKKELFSNISKSVVAKYLLYVFQIIALAIYSRLFSPEQFGVIAVITVFITFFVIFGESGISSALITRSNLTKEQINGIFSFTVLLALLFSFLFWCFLYLLNFFYNRDDYQTIGLYGVFSVFFSVVSSVPLAALIKDKQFFELSKNTIFAELFSIIIVIVLYEKVPDMYLIGVRFGLVPIVNFMLVMYSAKKTTIGMPFFGKSLSDFNLIRGFSIYVFGFNFLNYFSRNLDNILIGKYIGLVSLGLYERSYMLMKYPLQLITSAAAPAIQPVVKDFSKNKDDVCDAHSFIVEKVIVLSSVISTFLYCNAEMIVSILLGEQWREVSEIISVLAMAIPLQVATSFNGGFWQALDKTKEQFKVALFTASVMITLIFVGAVYFKTLIILAYLITFGLNLTCFNALYQIFRRLYSKSILYVFKLVSIGLIPFFLSVFVFEILVRYLHVSTIEKLFLTILLSFSCYGFFVIKMIKNR